MARQTSDFLKALAILAVILIHVADSYLQIHPRWSASWRLDIILDQISRFTVPLFVALSGYGLAIKYLRSPTSLTNFFLRRVLKILPWYLFWGTVLYLFVSYLGQAPAMYDHHDLLYLLYWGRTDYHLYFVPMIFQLYLLFPLLFLLIKRFPIPALLITLVFQITLYFFIGQKTEVIGNTNQIWPDADQYVFFYTWIFYFVLGIFLAIKSPLLKSLTSLKTLSLVLLFGGLSLTIFNSFQLLSAHVDPLIAMRFTRVPVIFYSVSFLLTGFAFLPKIVASFTPRSLGAVGPKSLTTLTFSLGRHSYVIYLCHTIFLRFVFSIFHWGQILPLGLSFALVLVPSYLTAVVFATVTKKLSPHLTLPTKV